jgi:hypothetical protein
VLLQASVKASIFYELNNVDESLNTLKYIGMLTIMDAKCVAGIFERFNVLKEWMGRIHWKGK